MNLIPADVNVLKSFNQVRPLCRGDLWCTTVVETSDALGMMTRSPCVGYEGHKAVSLGQYTSNAHPEKKAMHKKDGSGVALGDIFPEVNFGRRYTVAKHVLGLWLLNTLHQT